MGDRFIVRRAEARPPRRLVSLHGSILLALHGRHARQGQSEHGNQSSRHSHCALAEVKTDTIDTELKHGKEKHMRTARLKWTMLVSVVAIMLMVASIIGPAGAQQGAGPPRGGLPTDPAGRPIPGP